MSKSTKQGSAAADIKGAAQGAEKATPVTPEVQAAATQVATAVTKTSKRAAAATPKVRRPAKELMEERVRVTFGTPFINAAKAGTHADFDKLVCLARELKVDTEAKLLKLTLEDLRKKLADFLKDYTGEMPKAADFISTKMKKTAEKTAQTVETAAA
jgi:hypothetical protein